MATNPSDLADKASANPAAEKTTNHNDQLGTDPRDELIAELREAVRARDDFLAVAAHELRNPLTPILLSVQLIRGDFERSGRDSPELNRLERLINHFVTRTTMLLEVAQISSNKFHLEACELDLSELTKVLVEDYMPLVRRSGSALTTDIEPGIIAHLDRLAFSEIVENLLSNAVKYGEHKPIQVTLTAETELVRLIVRDQGLGIDSKDKDRIFERFERVVGREGRSGFGIGLWLTRKLAEGMGGSIEVDAKPGAGSVFVVTLPLQLRKIDEQ